MYDTVHIAESVHLVHKVWAKKTGHVQNLAKNKKSTIFVQYLWNLVKMITSRGNHFHQVSSGLDKNYGFFIDGQFLNVCFFFYSDLTSQNILNLVPITNLAPLFRAYIDYWVNTGHWASTTVFKEYSQRWESWIDL